MTVRLSIDLYVSVCPYVFVSESVYRVCGVFVSELVYRVCGCVGGRGVFICCRRKDLNG